MKPHQLALWGVVILLLSGAFRRHSFQPPFLIAGRSGATVFSHLEDEKQDLLDILTVFAESALWPNANLLQIERSINGGAGWYIKPWSIAWWDMLYHASEEDFDAGRWSKLVRVSRPTFQYLVESLTPALETEVSWAFRNIPNRVLTVDRQIAIALRRLATGDSAFSISELLGVSEATVYLLTKKVCKAIWGILKPSHLTWPTEREAIVKLIQGFSARAGLPNCCGAIDCTHFLIDLPDKEASTCWFDRDHNYGMIMQAVVDAEGKFLDVCIGWPGSVNDARVLKNSELFHKVERGEWLNGDPVETAGVQIGQYIVGDAGYPHYPWLLVPFPGAFLPNVKDRFNYFQSVTRIIVEIAFGRLKGIWRILMRRMYRPDIDFLPTLIGACSVLHNIMLERGDSVDEGLIPLPEEDPVGACPRPVRRGIQDAMTMREALADYCFLHL
jgi:hypothetical protein